MVKKGKKATHHLPQNDELPRGGVLMAFQHYCLGDPSRGAPPLR